jgi:hypothetical protein
MQIKEVKMIKQTKIRKQQAPVKWALEITLKTRVKLQWTKKNQSSIQLSNYCNTVKTPDISPITVNKFVFFLIKFIRINPLNDPNFKKIQRKFLFMFKEAVHRKRTFSKSH